MTKAIVIAAAAVSTIACAAPVPSEPATGTSASALSEAATVADAVAEEEVEETAVGVPCRTEQASPSSDSFYCDDGTRCTPPPGTRHGSSYECHPPHVFAELISRPDQLRTDCRIFSINDAFYCNFGESCTTPADYRHGSAAECEYVRN